MTKSNYETASSETKKKHMAQSGCAKKSKEMKKEIKTETVLFPVSYALIVVVSVLMLSMAFAGIVSADNEALEATVLPLTSEEKGSDFELSEKGKSRFAEPGLWVGTGEDIVPGTNSLSAEVIAILYRPLLYHRCPDEVYYRVVQGIDSWAKSADVYLIQYFAYWKHQYVPYHKYDYEPIFIWVRNIGEKPYRVAYDRCDFDPADLGTHYHQIHRTYDYILPDGEYPRWSSTNDKAYYPYGKTSHMVNVNLSHIDTSLKNNWNGNHVKLSIAHSWHTFDTDIPAGSEESCYYKLSPLTDEALKNGNYSPPTNLLLIILYIIQANGCK